MAQLRSSRLTSGTVKLSQDIATLINNRQGSDIQFKVGGNIPSSQENSETVYNESATVTIYAHSVILRCRSQYFAVMLDDEKQWKESSKGVIYKPNISPSTFQEVLYYIYTGNVRAKTENMIELITAAEEMGLEELSVGCQTEVIRVVKLSLSDKNNNDYGNESGETLEGSTERGLPINVVVRTLIIPAMKLAQDHTLSHFLQQLLTVVLPRITIITSSPDANKAFIDGISPGGIAQVLASDNLAMPERDVWDLALGWACHQTKLLKTAVETRIKMINNADEEEEEEEELDGSDGIASSGGNDYTLVSATRLRQLKAKLVPLLPAIRFSLFENNDYRRMIDTLEYFLPRRRSLELQRFFLSSNPTEPLDAPRRKCIDTVKKKPLSNIITQSTWWELLKKSIFGTGCMIGCPSSEYLKFELLFRASEHGFGANIFHQRCDNKGSTLVVVRIPDGHLFGGVNFVPWDSSSGWVSSPSNFLFALPDGNHRKDFLALQVVEAQYSVHNDSKYGPTFGGGNDLYIATLANTNQVSASKLRSYNRSRVPVPLNTLSGKANFTVSDYEVFAISNSYTL